MKSRLFKWTPYSTFSRFLKPLLFPLIPAYPLYQYIFIQHAITQYRPDTIPGTG